MGYLRPTAIIVTGTYGDHAERARSEALAIFAAHDLSHVVSELLPAAINHTESFLIAWDGSKEGWEPSDEGDAARAEFTTWLHEQAYEDGSSPLDWVEVQYGGDDREARVLDHGDAARAAA